VETIKNGRPRLRIAVRRRSKSRGHGLSPRPIGCMPTLPVTYSAAELQLPLVAVLCYAFYLFNAVSTLVDLAAV